MLPIVSGTPEEGPGSPPGHPARALLELAERAAREAGDLVERDRRARPVEVAATKSSPTDVVTATDRAAETFIRDLVRRNRPGDALFGEEAGFSDVEAPGERGSTAADRTGLTWVIDPIDGTVNYLYGLPIYAISVAVVDGDPGRPGGWRPIAGCVHNPVSGETWTALAGAGAWLDGAPITARQAVPLDRALVGTGFGYLPDRRRDQAEVLLRVLPRVRDIRRLGSAALDLCAVASGRLDAFYERGLNVWDIAAATLVLAESGCRIIGQAGAAASADLVVAGRSPLVDDLLAVLAEE